MDYHQGAPGLIEEALTGLSDRDRARLRGSSPIPAHVYRRLFSARDTGKGWIRQEDLEWLARLWGRYRTELPSVHDSVSIAGVGASLGVGERQLEPLWTTPFSHARSRTAIEEVIDRARATHTPVCFARLAHDLTWLRADRTAMLHGRTRAAQVRHLWRTDAATLAATETD